MTPIENERFVNAASSEGGNVAVAWKGEGSGAWLTLRTLDGTRQINVRNVLPGGGNIEPAVALSPGGRVHLYRGDLGLYAYSDNGRSWSAPQRIARSSRPARLVVDADRYAWIVTLSGGASISRQQPDGAWPAPAFLGAFSTVDAVATQNGVAVAGLSATGGEIIAMTISPDMAVGNLHRFGGGFDLVQAIYRLGVITVGLVDNSEGDHRAYIARSLDDGESWSNLCLVQRTNYPIYGTAGFPTRQGLYVAVWTWMESGQEKRIPTPETFSYMVVSSIKWEADAANCFVVHPGPSEAEALVRAGGGPPGLFYSQQQQTRFDLAVDDRNGLLAMDCLHVAAVNGEIVEATTDVCIAAFNPDTVLSSRRVQ